jgi:hypothetical protein
LSARLSADLRTHLATSASLAGGIGLTVFAWWALVRIPRTIHEFSYLNPSDGNALWPLPFAPLNGFTPEQLSSHVARVLFLLPGCVLAGSALWRWRIRVHVPSIGAVMAIGLLITAGIHVLVTRGVPLQDDEATYVMQARLFAEGRVADDETPPRAAFAEPFTLFTARGMTGMYPLGTPAVLAAGIRFGLPWAGQLAMVALTLWCAYRASALVADAPTAALGTLLLAISPMFTFTSAGFLSQVPALAGLAVLVWGSVTGGIRGGALAGTGLGLMIVSRPQAALPVGLALMALYGRRDRRLLIATVLAAIPWLVALGLDNYAITGRVWQMRRALYEGELESYGFGQVLRTYSHTPLKAAALAGVALVRLNAWGLGWPLSLAGPVLWFAVGRPFHEMVRPWAVAAFATFLFQTGYCSLGQSETGALYHYMTLPFIVFSTAAVLRRAAAIDSMRARWMCATAVALFALATSSFYVEHGLRISRLSHAIEGPRRALAVTTPTLLIEDVGLDRPQAGWVFGIPFRERADDDPVVRYPRPTRLIQQEYLAARWKDRDCRYLWYDWRQATYRVSSCAEIGAHDHVLNATERAEWAARSGLDARDRPWFEGGGWKRAFPYLPLED